MDEIDNISIVPGSIIIINALVPPLNLPGPKNPLVPEVALRRCEGLGAAMVCPTIGSREKLLPSQPAGNSINV